MSAVIGRIYAYNTSVIQYWWSCTPSHSIGLYFWGVRGSWVECHFCSLCFTICALLSADNSLILGCLWLLLFVVNNTLILGIWCSTISCLPGCYVPGPSFGISDSTWCHRTPSCHIWLLNLDILQGSFRLCNWLALWRLVSWITTCLLQVGPPFGNRFWNSWAVCDIMDSISYLLYFDICNYICLDTSYHFWLFIFIS